jgi:hypothetical protein
MPDAISVIGIRLRLIKKGAVDGNLFAFEKFPGDGNMKPDIPPVQEIAGKGNQENLNNKKTC